MMSNPEELFLCTRCHKHKDISCYSYRKNGTRLKTCDRCRMYRADLGYASRGGFCKQRNAPEQENLGDGNLHRRALQKPWSEIARFVQGGQN